MDDASTFNSRRLGVSQGETHTVEEFYKAFGYVNLDYKLLQTSEEYLRPNEVDYLLGDPSKAKEKLNWNPKLLKIL